ncbi:MAG: efflux RND transporter periplasmic adaptor subunit, partial [Desulfovibrio sp.]|nr:efflux RND transporter periplasmic adaptor subunit [Desulfovibrio sp.]
RITAPASGLTGLRKVDAGNQIQANDSEGLVRITEITPCEVLFTLPETTIPLVTNSLKHKKGAPLLVQAWDREQKKLLAKGTFLSLDNEIDANTGTVRLKARFANTERELYAQQFVNARLCVEIIEKAITIPSSAVQLGAQGSFVYVLKNTDGPKEAKGAEKEGAKSALEVELLRAAPKIGTIERRVVKLGLETARLCVIYEGLKPGEWVVVDGLDRLREGSKAKVAGHISTPLAEKL